MAIKHTFKYLRSTQNGIEERIETRNLTRAQAIKYNCLDCSGGFPSTVKQCNIPRCPLYAFRPYQNRS